MSETREEAKVERGGHTPGPWGEVGGLRATRRSNFGDYSVKVMARDDRGLCCVATVTGGNHDAAEHAEANARVVAAAPAVLEKAAALLAALDDFQCQCSAAERYSGHRVDCRMPWVQEAAAELRAALPATPES
jgi:hypothetical protein